MKYVNMLFTTKEEQSREEAVQGPGAVTGWSLGTSHLSRQSVSGQGGAEHLE